MRRHLSRALALIVLFGTASLGVGCTLQRGTGHQSQLDAHGAIDGAIEVDAEIPLDADAPDAAIDPDAAVEPDAWLAPDGGPPVDAGGGNGPVDLGTAASFAVLGAAMVTSSGLTVVTGDLGTSASLAVVGFPPGIVRGAMHRGDPVAVQAGLDLTAAYDDAAGRTGSSILTAGNLGGRTLPPGLYTSTSTLEISTGNLTLDAGGDEDAVWVFQIGTSFAVTAACQILLTGGARAANVFWQVGSAATFGAGTVIVGTFMADQTITVGAGSTVEGRLLARVASVTLADDLVSLPTP